MLRTRRLPVTGEDGTVARRLGGARDEVRSVRGIRGGARSPPLRGLRRLPPIQCQSVRSSGSSGERILALGNAASFSL